MGFLGDPTQLLGILSLLGIGLAGVATVAIIADLARGRRQPRLEELKARIGELLAEKEALERKLLEAEEQLAEARTACEREKAELVRSMQEKIEALRRDYEARLREAMDENRAALSLYEAVKAGKIMLQAEGCKEILVQLDGTVLCRKSGLELEVLWPREEPGGKAEAGEG